MSIAYCFYLFFDFITCYFIKQMILYRSKEVRKMQKPEKEKDRWLKYYLALLATLDTVIAILALKSK